MKICEWCGQVNLTYNYANFEHQVSMCVNCGGNFGVKVEDNKKEDDANVV